MTTVVEAPMPRPRKVPNRPQQGEPLPGLTEKPKDEKPKERLTEAVKLRPTFKERLQKIAERRKVDMGIIIEQQMLDWVNREWRVVLQEEIDEAKAKLAQSEE